MSIRTEQQGTIKSPTNKQMTLKVIKIETQYLFFERPKEVNLRRIFRIFNTKRGFKLLGRYFSVVFPLS
jgi:hypothetical protein